MRRSMIYRMSFFKPEHLLTYSWIDDEHESSLLDVGTSTSRSIDEYSEQRLFFVWKMLLGIRDGWWDLRGCFKVRQTWDSRCAGWICSGFNKGFPLNRISRIQPRKFFAFEWDPSSWPKWNLAIGNRPGSFLIRTCLSSWKIKSCLVMNFRLSWCSLPWSMESLVNRSIWRLCSSLYAKRRRFWRRLMVMALSERRSVNAQRKLLDSDVEKKKDKVWKSSAWSARTVNGRSKSSKERIWSVGRWLRGHCCRWTAIGANETRWSLYITCSMQPRYWLWEPKRNLSITNEDIGRRSMEIFCRGSIHACNVFFTSWSSIVWRWPSLTDFRGVLEKIRWACWWRMTNAR